MHSGACLGGAHGLAVPPGTPHPPPSPALAASAAGTPTNVSAEDVPINSGFKMPDARISAGEARPSLHLFLRFVNGQFHSVKCSLITFQQ